MDHDAATKSVEELMMLVKHAKRRWLVCPEATLF